MTELVLTEEIEAVARIMAPSKHLDTLVVCCGCPSVEVEGHYHKMEDTTYQCLVSNAHKYGITVTRRYCPECKHIADEGNGVD